MKYEQYTSLIKRLEKFAAEKPATYQSRVVMLAALGYGYFLVIILLALSVPTILITTIWFYPNILFILLRLGKVGILVAILAVVAVGFVWSILRVLWFRLPPPQGSELQRSDAPQLFEMVEESSAALKTPQPQHILLNDEFNASIVSLPRWGGLASETYLNVGLPLMQALSPEQFRAVVAHEMGHLSSSHGSYSAWIYRLRESWARFLDFENTRGGNVSFLYAKFLQWYFPYFNAYTFVLAREQEREADRCAVQLSGVTHAGEALINCELKASAIGNNFWKKVLDQAAVQPAPPKQVFSQMALAFRQPSESSQDVLTLTKALSVRTDYSDTHPCLADRLTAIGYWKKPSAATIETEELPPLPVQAEKLASDYFLGKLADKFIRQFDQEWQIRVTEQWKARHQSLQEAQKRIDELNAKDSTEEGLNADELYERACLVADKHGNQQSLPYFQELVVLHPKHAAANFTLGSLLLDENDENGIAYLKEAIKAEPKAQLSGNEKIFLFLQSRGREEEAKPYLEKAERAYERLEAANKERETISDGDKFELPILPAEDVQAIQERLGWHEEITAAYLVRKTVKNMPEHPCHVLCLKVKRKFLALRSGTLSSGVSEQDLLDVVVNQVAEFGVQFVVIFGKDFKGIERKVKKLPQSRIYGF